MESKFRNRSLLTIYTRNFEGLENWLDQCQEVLSSSSLLRNRYSLILMKPSEYENCSSFSP